jgi:hypothetical protein
MRSTVALAVGEALFPMLSGFQDIGLQPLRAVWQIESDACLDRIFLEFETVSLIVSAVPDDDSVDFEFGQLAADKSQALDVSAQPQWKDLVGTPFGWGWVTVNQQGYCDGLLLSFGGICPQVILNVAGSSIKVGRVGEIPGLSRISRP